MIIGIIIVVVALVLAVILAKKISRDYAKDQEYIQQQGGMQKMYSTFINGIMEYKSAKINDDDNDDDNSLPTTDYPLKTNEVTITGDYTAEKDGSKHGTWELVVKHTFKIVQIDLTTKIYFNDVVQGAKHWEFPIDKDQNEMLKEVKKKMDEAKEQGLVL